MKIYNGIFVLFCFIMIMDGCKKKDKADILKPKTAKNPVKYFRFYGVDGELILSKATIIHWLTAIDPQTGIKSDTIISYNKDEIFGFFPAASENGPYLDAGVVAFNDHPVYAGNDYSYLLESMLDTFNFPTSTFASTWNVQGSPVLTGFTDYYTSNNFPSAFQYTTDTVIHISSGYLINLIGGTLTNTDSIVYIINDILHPNIYIFKVTSSIANSCSFSPTDLSIFTSGNSVCISVIAYNFRHEVKNGNEDIYFINQRKNTNEILAIRP